MILFLKSMASWNSDGETLLPLPINPTNTGGRESLEIGGDSFPPPTSRRTTRLEVVPLVPLLLMYHSTVQS